MIHLLPKFFKGNCKHPKFRKKKEDSIRFAVRSSDVSFKGSDKRYAFIPVLSSKKGDLIDCGNHNIPRARAQLYKNRLTSDTCLILSFCSSVKL